MSIDWSLDDIIKARRKKDSDAKEEMSRKRRIDNKTSNKVPKGNIDGKWEHDLFRDSEPKRNVKVLAAKRRINGISTLRVGNLPTDLTDKDFEDMLSEFNGEEICPVYDENRQFLGITDLTYRTKSDALVALEKFKTCCIDGKRLSVKLANNRDAPPISTRITFESSSVQNRLSFPRQDKIRKPRIPHQMKQKESRRKDYNFLDRLAGDEEFQKEEEEKRKLKELDNDLDVYMKRVRKM